MKTRTHLQKKSPQRRTAATVKNAILPSGFIVQSQGETPYSPFLAPISADKTILQAKTSDFWQQGLKKAQLYGHDFSQISLHRTDAPAKQPVQMKLTIGAPGDKYEQEADRVASQVVNQINAPVSGQPNQNLQREKMSSEDEELMMKSEISSIQRSTKPEEEEELQAKPVLQLKAGNSGTAATAELEDSIQQARGGGQPLAKSIRKPMERAFGSDFSGVRIHADSQADQLNQSIQARAFTTGQDVFFRQGAYEPGSRKGQELIGHELTHVVQQNGGRVQRLPAIQREDENENPHYEGQELKGSISSLQELRKEIENLLDDKFIGVRALFMAGGIATQVEKWGELLYGLLSHKNDIEGLEEEDCTDIVKDIKAENRKEEFLRITEFYSYFDGAVDDYPHNLEQFKQKLQRDEVYIEEADESIISLIFDNSGDREALAEDPKQAFQIGSEEYNLDEKGLKALLDEELGESVNWGHEISDCMRDSGKKGELYYYQTGKGLTAVGKSSQSHASSKGGKTIIWEESSGTIEILAIGKHTTRGDTSLSKGASYEILKVFGSDYSGYKNKIVGFKS
jgi:Domain of unknown function (DUF4157)